MRFLIFWMLEYRLSIIECADVSQPVSGSGNGLAARRNVAAYWVL